MGYLLVLGLMGYLLVFGLMGYLLVLGLMGYLLVLGLMGYLLVFGPMGYLLVFGLMGYLLVFGLNGLIGFTFSSNAPFSLPMLKDMSSCSATRSHDSMEVDFLYKRLANATAAFVNLSSFPGLVCPCEGGMNQEKLRSNVGSTSFPLGI